MTKRSTVAEYMLGGGFEATAKQGVADAIAELEKEGIKPVSAINCWWINAKFVISGCRGIGSSTHNVAAEKYGGNRLGVLQQLLLKRNFQNGSTSPFKSDTANWLDLRYQTATLQRHPPIECVDDIAVAAQFEWWHSGCLRTWNGSGLWCGLCNRPQAFE